MTGSVHRIAAIFVIASLINYPWEIDQKSFFDTDASLAEFALHCIIPSLGDGLILLIIYFVGVIVFRNADWSDRPGIAGYGLMLVTGLVIAVAIEWNAVHILERWRYSSSMPRLPWLGVGLIPIFQMLVLPPIIFKGTAWWLHRRKGHLL